MVRVLQVSRINGFGIWLYDFIMNPSFQKKIVVQFAKFLIIQYESLIDVSHVHRNMGTKRLLYTSFSLCIPRDHLSPDLNILYIMTRAIGQNLAVVSRVLSLPNVSRDKSPQFIFALTTSPFTSNSYGRWEFEISIWRLIAKMI